MQPVINSSARFTHKIELLLPLGLALGATTFLGLHAFSGWLHSQFPVRRLFIAFFCVFLLPVAQFAALALLSSAGFSVNLLHFTSPLSSIALLVAVHGSFQLADAFCRLLAESKRKQFTASERLASTFEQVKIFICLKIFITQRLVHLCSTLN